MDSDTVWTEGPTLSAWLYDSPRGAAAGKVRLDRLSQMGAVDLVDAATVTWVRGAHRPRVGRPHIGTLPGPVRRSPLGVLLGRLLFRHRTAEDAVRALAAELRCAGLEEEFLRQLRAAMVADTSALLVLARAADFDAVQLVIERGKARGDVRLLHVPLTTEELAAIEALATRSAAAER